VVVHGACILMSLTLVGVGGGRGNCQLSSLLGGVRSRLRVKGWHQKPQRIQWGCADNRNCSGGGASIEGGRGTCRSSCGGECRLDGAKDSIRNEEKNGFENL